MTVAFDAVSNTGGSSIGATPNPGTWTHTPTGTPRAIVVMMFDGVTSGDLITGITYGGVAMTRTPNGLATIGGEAGSGYAYFLGASVPTGAQTVSVAHTGTADGKWGCAVSFTATGDCELLDSAIIESVSQANPTYTYDSGSRDAIRLLGGFHGSNDTTLLAAQAGSTILAARDSGTKGGIFARQSSASAGSGSVGITVGADDVAFACLAVAEEVPPATGLTGTLTQKAPSFFVGRLADPATAVGNRLGGVGAIRRPPRIG